MDGPAPATTDTGPSNPDSPVPNEEIRVTSPGMIPDLDTTTRTSTVALLSLTTGILLCPFGDLHAAIEAIAGGPVWTHQLPAAAPALAAEATRQHPWLADVPTPDGISTEDDCTAYTAPLIAKHGTEHTVRPIAGGWSSNPIADAVAMVGPDRVIPVVIEP